MNATQPSPTAAELRDAIKLLSITAEFTPVASASEPARLTNARQIMLALSAKGWLPPHMREHTIDPEPVSGALVSARALTAAPTEHLLQGAIGIIRTTARYAGVQANGKPPRMKNERAVLLALINAGWLDPSARDYATENYTPDGEWGATVNSAPTAA